MCEENEFMDKNKYDDGHNEEVYIVVNEGEVVFVSFEKEEADNYAYNKGLEARDEVLEEMGCDEDLDEKDLFEAEFQAGYDGGVFEVHYVDMSQHKEDDVIFVGGDEIEYNDIVMLLEKDDDEYENY